MKNEILIKYIFSVADNALILGQRISELCGHGPTLETDIAMTNISLDLFGQTRGYYQYAAKLSEDGKTEDDFAFLRNEREYINVLLVEQPNRNFAYTVARQFLFDHFHLLLMRELQDSTDDNLAAVAKKSIKEVSYHVRFSSDWIKRLGDGTAESHEKIQEAIDDLWRFTDELFHPTEAEKTAVKEGVGVDVSALKTTYYENVSEVLKKATLKIPELKYFQKGGKNGVHTEYMGFILADMQYMQKTFPGMKW
ncbi:MAG TPA: 1,2-phenylacetyl-CoA epoxidase subunit PaaC [Flavobacteriaceae bacterium]|nr:1,2-phenylacetyl-CoA epoxidase subunit PaaC [Flavobacteriaceae bacterium]